MSFITPALFIAGIVGITLPILIHLLSRQRRRPVEWAAMRFLLEALSRQRRRLQVEQIILLVLRCLIVAVLGFALARPLLQQSGFLDAGGDRVVYLVIDDGLVSGTRDDDDVPALDHHIAQAVEVVNELGGGDAVGLVTASMPARGIVVPPSTDHAAVLRVLRDLKPAESSTDLSAALGLVADALSTDLDDETRGAVYLFSDFRTGSVALDESLPKTFAAIGERLALLATPPAETMAPNVQIVDVRPLRRFVLSGGSDVATQVGVRLRRTGGELGREITRVRLGGEGIVPADPKVVEWEPGASETSVDFVVSFAGQSREEIGLVASIDADRLDADNQRQVVLTLRDRIRTVIIDRRSFGFDPSLEAMSAGQWIRRALEPSDLSPVELVQVEPESLEAADLRIADVCVLPRPDLLPDAGWPRLKSFVDRGGLLIISPPGDTNVHGWVDHLAADLDLPWVVGIEAVVHPDGLLLADDQPESELLRMISADMEALVAPIVTTRVLPVDPDQTQAERVLLFTDGTPLVIAGAPGQVASGADGDATPPVPPTPDGVGPVRSRGLVVYIAAAPRLAWTNLPSKPLMVPLFHETIRQGLSLVRGGGSIVTGRRPVLAVAGGAAEVRVLEDDAPTIGLDPSARPETPLEQAGLYGVLDGAGQDVGLVAVNVDPESGRTEAQSAAAIADWLGPSGDWRVVSDADLTAPLQDVAISSPLAGAALWILLGLILLETVLARWFSHAFRRSGTPTLASTAGSPVRPTVLRRSATQ